MKFTKLFDDFFASEKAGGIILIICAAASLALANSGFQTNYIGFWHIPFQGHSLEYWINGGLMTIFFLLIGLELEREIYNGELSSFRKAALSVVSATGGMVVPAVLFLLFNLGTAYKSGAGIPMATDIAFAIGVLSLLGRRVPFSLKIFLTAMAVIDDLGAIIVIAVFYTNTLSLTNVGIALGIFSFLFLLRWLKVRNLIPYLIGGVFMWYFMLHSGIHATITGVLLALVIPFGDGKEKSPSYILQKLLHKPVAFLILPLFALANTCIVLQGSWHHSLMQPISLGILAGLVLGKPLGIVLFGFLAVITGLCKLPHNMKWKQIVGIGFLGGIGFTMSVFITLLAFNQPDQINEAKIAIIVSSCIASIIGYLWLSITLKEPGGVNSHN